MERTNGTKVLATTATLAMAGGLAAVLYGTLRADLARALGGTCVTLTALTIIALILIRRWIVDTSHERQILAASQRETQNQKSMYIAAQAALEVEQGRLTRDRAAQLRADAARLKAERAAMDAEFEEKRAELVTQTMEATVLLIRSGKATAPAATENKVIQFPSQHAQAHPTRERSREHGGARP
ncbi:MULTISPECIES: hypothetical protein [unclassified Streptomyces]|uniref:hypothetical protein n=1 Tax=unclassified Streptomyces TaxID=2593676 RepID=UPI0036EDDEAF